MSVIVQSPGTLAATDEFVWLERRHPQYEAYAAHWSFLRDSYVGGPEFIGSHLFRFWREKDPKWKNRLQRAYRYNFARKVTDIITGYLWEQPPSRNIDKLPEKLKAFWHDADREGNSIDAVMAQQVSPWVCVYGRPWIVVDKPREVGATREDAKRDRLHPYLTVVAPTDVLDARFANGELEWILLRETVRDDLNAKLSRGGIGEQFRLWTKTNWEVWKLLDRGKTKEAVFVAGDAHELGVVPVVPMDFKAAISRFVSPSLIWEVAYLDRSIFNHLSLLDEELYNATFSQLAIPWQAILAGQGMPEGNGQVDAAAGARKHVAEIGTEEVFVYDGKAGTAPAYVAPDPAPAQTLENRVEREINEIFRHLSLAGEMAQEASTPTSGISKEHEFRKLNKMLATLGDNHESAERSILRIAARWEGEDPAKIPDDVVDYPESFDVTTMMEELEEIREMTTAGLPDLVVNEARKETVTRRFSKLPPEKLKAMLAAVDKVVGIPTIDLRDPRRKPEPGPGGGTGDDDEDKDDDGGAA